MKRSITSREILLTCILLVLLGYLLVYNGPIKNKMEELEYRKASLETQIANITPKVQQMNAWQKELDKIFANDPNPRSIPEYNNFNKMLQEMNDIFLGVNNYNLTFTDPTLEDNIVTHYVSISFSCNSYEDLRARLQLLHDSQYKYQMGDMSISLSTSGGGFNWGFGGGSTSTSYSVTLQLICHEYSVDNTLDAELK